MESLFTMLLIAAAGIGALVFVTWRIDKNDSKQAKRVSDKNEV